MTAVDVVEICSRLLAIDSSNYGPDGPSSEREAAEYIVGLLEPAGYRPEILESAPRRANVVLRVPGEDPTLPGLLVHGHTDVVPVERDQWSVDPFGGEVRDGYLWGRGATDMKDAVSMMLACLLRWNEDGARPRRDIVFAFVADEEDCGNYGAQWLVSEHPELFDGVGGAIGESGGFVVPVADVNGVLHRFYPIAAAERGIMHLAVTARGTAGHGGSRNPDSAVAKLIGALARVADHRWPIRVPATVQAFFDVVGPTLGISPDLSSHEGFDATLLQIGDLEDVVRSTVQCTTNPTVLRAGEQVNVIPSSAYAEIDVRTLPGTEDETLRILDELLGDDVEWRFIENRPALETSIDTEWYRAMRACIEQTDPEAVVVPRLLGGGTDAKAFGRLGIACYGFTPTTQDPQGRTGSGMHGVDERVPVSSLQGGLEVLYRFLSTV
ncbi:M20/M25/M40 family metallo-hydrolase [Nakamurella lactea]|uniref:M20/M25/M40 family metallo-hydrolase n=1 Tax=Nakamurella lactea TaxID=459515 RepID=UPI0003F4DA54|nr:M20/M25/M40 family metallo-hydrolase [Nakamurella lactea]